MYVRRTPHFPIFYGNKKELGKERVRWIRERELSVDCQSVVPPGTSEGFENKSIICQTQDMHVFDRPSSHERADRTSF